MGVWYCTREAVKQSLDIKVTTRSDDSIDRAIEGASRMIEGFLHRKFYPWTGTRYFDWPPPQRSRAWRLWLDEDELISVTTLVTGGKTVPNTDYFLEPVNLGPPYTYIEMNLARSSAWGGGSTHQRDIAVTGVFGYSATEVPVGTLSEALDATETGVDVADGSTIGVGSILRIDSERMIVTGRTWLTSAQTLQTPMGVLVSDVTVAVTNGAAFSIGEVLLLDAERMLIIDIAGNNLFVKRAWDGTVLAAHTGSTIYASRTLTVTRGALGTTAAIHNNGASIQMHTVPGLVEQLCVAESAVGHLQELGGYARVAGSGDASREPTGRTLAGARRDTGQSISDLRERAYTAYGRKVRTRSV